MTFARMRALAIVGVLGVAAVVLVAVTITNDNQSKPAAASCAKDAIMADTTLHNAENIQLNVYNATSKPNLAREIANELKQRKFKVDPAKANNDPLKKRVDGVAVLRYGPKAVGSAAVVNSHFLNDAVHEFDLKRTDDGVDVVLGTGFKKLATSSDQKWALAQAGRPDLPKGTCDIRR